MFSKLSYRGRVFAVLLAVLCFTGRAWAEGSAVPGRSVGHVFLGMERADVWKILQKPSKTYTVAHGMTLYSADKWTNSSKNTLTVISEKDKVVQIEWDSPRITTTDGLSTQTTFAQVRRRHPAMTVRSCLVLYEFTHYKSGEGILYIDDARQGLAFTLSILDGIEPDYINDTKPDTIIIHFPGSRVMPINEGRWSKEAPNYEPQSLRVVRNWFTPKGVQR